MKKILTFAAAAMLAAIVANAIPAKPGLLTITQSDGTTVQVQQLGDEFHHSLATADGLTIDQGADGDYYYLSATGLTIMRAHNAASRSAAEQAFVAQHAGQFTLSALQQAAQRSGQQRARKAPAPQRVGQTQVPTMGSPRVPIILVQYTDKKMSNPVSAFERQYKTGPKSVLQYFTDQSNGQYTPQYDLYGIYDLPQNRATYGGNSGGNDKGVALMVCDAIDKAGDDIDWSLYDNDGDGEADVCIVVYAGVGEAQSSVRNSVWPCQWQLSYGEAYGDGRGAQTRNGVLIDKFAVFNEVGGYSDYGTTLDGIGTFCHEFSHCLGLPDFYETTYGNGYYGMGNWSLMNSGCYNDDGNTPIGYSAYEKEFMSWITSVEPTDNTQYTLPVFNQGGNDMALKITALNENEFWMVENRRQQGWDQYIPDEGVLITHFTYVPSRWEDNTVNNKAVQLATIIPADNSLSSYSESRDLFGESNHRFTATSNPSMRANMYASGVLASSTGGAGAVDKPLTDIYLNDDGTASLWYRRGYIVKEDPEITAIDSITGTGFTARWTPGQSVADYTLYMIDLDAPLPDVELVMSETFPIEKFTKEGAMEISTQLDSLMDNAGWTGAGLFMQAGGIRLGSGTKLGELTSPALDLKGSTTLTVKVNVRPYSSDSDVKFNVAYGDQVKNLTLQAGDTAAIVLQFDDVTDGGKVSFTTTATRKRAVISGIEFYNGELVEPVGTLRAPVETGNDYARTIEGITDTCYTVTGLNAGHQYRVSLRARFTDETRGDWCTPWTVQLLGDLPIEYEQGDVNGDHRVDIDDVNILLNIILENDSADNYDGRAYILGGDTVAIDDVNALINILLAQ